MNPTHHISHSHEWRGWFVVTQTILRKGFPKQSENITVIRGGFRGPKGPRSSLLLNKMFDGECKNVQKSYKIASNSLKMLEIVFRTIKNSTFSGGVCPGKDHHRQPTGHPTLRPLLSKIPGSAPGNILYTWVNTYNILCAFHKFLFKSISYFSLIFLLSLTRESLGHLQNGWLFKIEPCRLDVCFMSQNQIYFVFPTVLEQTLSSQETSFLLLPLFHALKVLYSPSNYCRGVCSSYADLYRKILPNLATILVSLIVSRSLIWKEEMYCAILGNVYLNFWLNCKILKMEYFCTYRSQAIKYFCFWISVYVVLTLWGFFHWTNIS